MQKLSPALCQKLENIVNNYIKNFPTEWEAFRIQMKAKRSQQTKWAEMAGEQGVVIRALLEIPETLWALFKIGLTDSEMLEFKTENTKNLPIYQQWLSKRFPDFKVSEENI